MLRALHVIVSAILMSRPTMPVAEASHYARVVSLEAVAYDFDPLTAVAIVHFESQWVPSAVSPDGEDYGLGQVRARWMSGCRGDADPVHAPSPACLAAKATLLSADANLHRMAVIISANRVLCKEKIGKGDLPHWLAGYEGLSAPSREHWCAPGAKTWQVVAYRRELIAKLVMPAEPIKRVAAARGRTTRSARSGKSSR